MARPAKIRTFLDAGVIIAAHRGQQPDNALALALVGSSDRLLVASTLLYVEVVPKALHFKNRSEIRFYREYFDRQVKIWIHDLNAITKLALKEAQRSGLGAMDALHVAAASIAGADEFVTTERPRKRIHKTKLVRVVSLEQAKVS